MLKLFATACIAFTLVSLLAAYHFRSELSSERSLKIAALDSLNAKEDEHNKALTRIKELEKAVSNLSHPSPVRSPTATSNSDAAVVAAPVTTEPDSLPSETQEKIASARVRAIGKVINLSEDQKLRLQRKFTAEFGQMGGKSSAEASSTESLEDIIGKDNAEFYRNQRRDAFERARLEDLEKEVLYLSRKLDLTRPQEERLRTIMNDVESEAKSRAQAHRQSSQNASRLGMVEDMLNESQLRDSLLLERLKPELNPTQFETYLTLRENSAGRELEVWHGN